MDFSGNLPLWKAHWPADALMRKRAEIGPRAFDRGYRMRAFADEDYLFPHFEKALELGRKESIPEPLPPDWHTFMGVDLAGPKRPGNVIWCGSVDAHGIRRPLEIRRIQGSSPEVARQIGEVNRHWKARAIMVENNGYQNSIIEWIQKLHDEFSWWMNVVAFTTGMKKVDPQFGLPGLDIEFMNGAWIVPRELNPRVNEHDLNCDCGACVWVQEMSNYPHSAATDTVMASYFFSEACRQFKMEIDDRDQFLVPAQDGVFEVPLEDL